MFITIIKYSQVKIQKQGQNIKIQHGFICFHFCQLNSPTRECSLFVSDLSQLRCWTYSSSQAASECTAASLFNFKGKGFWGEKALHWLKKKKKRKRRMRHVSFQLLLSQSLLPAYSLNMDRQQCQASPYHPVISGGPKFQSSHFTVRKIYLFLSN